MIIPWGSHVCRANLLVLANPSQGSSLEKTDSSPFRPHRLPIAPLGVEYHENSFIQVDTQLVCHILGLIMAFCNGVCPHKEASLVRRGSSTSLWA